MTPAPGALIDFGGRGPELHLAHANGYPPRAYTPLAETLTARFHVTAALTRPLLAGSPPNGLRDWWPLADDLAQFLGARQARGWVGVGHSLGGVLTLAVALRQPECFSAIVLIDPVLFPATTLLAWDLFRRLGLGRYVHPLIPSALRRRRVFSSADEMFSRYRRAPVFSRLDDRGLRAYVDALARPRPAPPGQPAEVELAFTPEWEAKIYETGPMNLWGQLSRLQVPLLVIRGAESDTFRPRSVAELRRRLPTAVVHEVPGAGHLVPLEKPAEVGRLIVEFVEAIGKS